MGTRHPRLAREEGGSLCGESDAKPKFPTAIAASLGSVPSKTSADGGLGASSELGVGPMLLLGNARGEMTTTHA